MNGTKYTMLKYSRSKLIKKAYTEYQRNSTNRDIHDIYKKPSREKIEAFNDCWRLMMKLGGHDLRIINFNTYHFTVGFLYEIEDRAQFFVYVTPTKQLEISTNEI